MGFEQVIQLQIIALLGLGLIGVGLWVYRQVRTIRAGLPTTPAPDLPLLIKDRAVMPGAGRALMTPPNLKETVNEMIRRAPHDRYRVPVGWAVGDSDKAGLVYATLVNGINHTLITGKQDTGKDNLATAMLLSLARLHAPDQVQFCIIDGKGLDFAEWDERAHTWRIALEKHDIEPTMRALSAERERRGSVLRAARVTKWDAYTGGDLPLLVVYVSELSLLQDATSRTDLESWMNTELAAGRAFGIRYIVATQTASNFPTRWRSQIDMFVAGFQPSQSQDEPNTGLTTKEIRAAGGVPPADLPQPASGAKGVFTVVFGRDVETVRVPYVNDADRRAWLEALPGASRRSNAVESAVEALPVDLGSGQNDTAGKHGSTEALGLSPVERQAIIEAAQVETSRSKVAQRVFGSRGGRGYLAVKAVCDEEGLLVGESITAA